MTCGHTEQNKAWRTDRADRASTLSVGSLSQLRQPSLPHRGPPGANTVPQTTGALLPAWRTLAIQRGVWLEILQFPPLSKIRRVIGYVLSVALSLLSHTFHAMLSGVLGSRREREGGSELG